eukprot:CAMPEP_0171155690 /NCGR_PEP_ID=MMETSP0790-20130122/1039_1 /TAXON_ID=2925 /ORGANISM="Alexandrium catenella, Strain OF101" /LENGTH=83 /DNA_ID=CAMNT_0011619935 /DNA_START=32 /DNA_END=280 /DNA_ORIENTATION=-
MEFANPSALTSGRTAGEARPGWGLSHMGCSTRYRRRRLRRQWPRRVVSPQPLFYTISRRRASTSSLALRAVQETRPERTRKEK